MLKWECNESILLMFKSAQALAPLRLCAVYATLPIVGGDYAVAARRGDLLYPGWVRRRLAGFAAAFYPLNTLISNKITGENS